MSDREEELAREVEKIQQMAKDDPEVDSAELVKNLLERDKGSYLRTGQKIRAYLISFLFPPFGLYYVVKFYFRSEQDAKKAAGISLALTVLAFVFLWFVTSTILSSVSELDQLNEDQVRELIDLYQY